MMTASPWPPPEQIQTPGGGNVYVLLSSYFVSMYIFDSRWQEAFWRSPKHCSDLSDDLGIGWW